ncbi:hypothetical protein DS475_02475 [Salmonella enterica subsp. enterica serovar Livingstone]|nr:hypothetical protein [Salmonella enterica subsp. enterica serovar Livingstone]
MLIFSVVTIVAKSKLLINGIDLTLTKIKWFLCKLQNLILCNSRHLLMSIAGINKSISFQW